MRRPRPAVAGFIFLVLTSVPARGTPVSFRVQVTPGETSSSSVVAEIRISGGASGKAQTETSLRSAVPGVVTVDLAQPATWYARANAPGFWGETRVVMTPHADDVIDLRLWPAATLQAELPPSAKVSKAGVRFQPVAGDSAARNAFPAGTNDCSVHGRKVECAIPAGRSDYSLVIPGYVPVYRWDQTYGHGDVVNLGKLELREGASLIGRVTLAPGATLAKGARVRVHLEPQAAAILTPTDEQRTQLAASTVPATARGNFALEGLKPGAYLLTASAPGLISEAREISIIDTLEAELRAPLELARPRTLVVSVDPPTDPWRARWVVELVRIDTRNRQSFSVASSAASLNGEWTRGGLPPAEYLLSVRREPQGVWHSQRITLTDDVHLNIAIPLVKIAGILRLGEAPLAGSLWFGGERGAIAVPVTTNREGRFEGIIPATDDGVWKQVDVTAENPTVRRSLTDIRIPEPDDGGISRLTIELPSSKIYGEVTTERGAAIQSATVFLSMPDGTRELLQTHADESGQFSLNGLAPGSYSLRAIGLGGKSDTIAVTIDETSQEYVTLVLRRNGSLHGNVSSRFGGVAGARVSAYPDDRSGFDLVEWSSTDPEGRFAVAVPPTARAITVTVAAPGFPFQFFRMSLDSETSTQVQVEQNGGRLQITLAGPQMPFVFHGGGFLALQDLLGDGIATMEGTTATAESVQPGSYEVCDATPIEALMFGQTVRPAERCTAGTLAPGGQLTLTAPDPSP